MRPTLHFLQNKKTNIIRQLIIINCALSIDKGFNNASASQRFHKDITERYEKDQTFARKQYLAALLFTSIFSCESCSSISNLKFRISDS